MGKNKICGWLAGANRSECHSQRSRLKKIAYEKVRKQVLVSRVSL